MFALISYVPFALCHTGSAASALHDVLRPVVVVVVVVVFYSSNKSTKTQANETFHYTILVN